MHFISSSAALPPIGTVAADAVREWPMKGGRWMAALEGSMHTREIHGGSWEGYAQSKWVSEQILLTEPDNDLESERDVVVHRFASLAGDADMIAVLAASVAVGALPKELETVEWLGLESLAKDLAWSILGEARRGVRHYSRRISVVQLQEAMGCSLEAVDVAEWRARISGRVAKHDQQECRRDPKEITTGGPLGEAAWARVGVLTAVGSTGLEGAIGLCERRLGGVRDGDGSVADAAACAEAVMAAL